MGSKHHPQMIGLILGLPHYQNGRIWRLITFLGIAIVQYGLLWYFQVIRLVKHDEMCPEQWVLFSVGNITFIELDDGKIETGNPYTWW